MERKLVYFSKWFDGGWKIADEPKKVPLTEVVSITKRELDDDFLLKTADGDATIISKDFTTILEPK